MMKVTMRDIIMYRANCICMDSEKSISSTFLVHLVMIRPRGVMSYYYVYIITDHTHDSGALMILFTSSSNMTLLEVVVTRLNIK